MHIWLHRIELLVDRLIPPMLAALLIVIIGELFFSHQFEWYKHYADLFDGFVIIVFAADLGFKYSRIRKVPAFVKKYWLEIIATIPFFLVFRLLEFFRISDVLETTQAFAHEGAAAGKLEKEVELIAKETARAGEVSRTAKLLNTFRAIGRFPRMIRAAHFFEKPTGQHYWHEKAKPAGKKRR